MHTRKILKTLSFCLLSFCLTTFNVQVEATFADTTQEAYDYFANLGALPNNGQIQPNKNITLAEFAFLLVQGPGIDFIKQGASFFDNVDSATEAGQAIITLEQRGGLVQTYYRAESPPELNLSRALAREEACFLAVNFLDLDTLQDFNFAKLQTKFEFLQDLKPENPNFLAVLLCLELGLMQPVAADYFGTRLPVSFAAGLDFVYAALQQITASFVPVFQDVDYSAQLNFFQEIINLIEINFINAELLATELDSLMNAAIEAFVKALGDEHTIFLDQEDVQIMQDSFEDSFEGIGAYLKEEKLEAEDATEEVKQLIEVVSVIENSPAEEAGLKARDQIIAVDGVDITETSLTEAVYLIRGPKGTEVTLTVQRPQDNSERFTTLEIVITRDTIEIESVKLAYQGSVAVLTITHFIEGTGAEVCAAVQEVAARSQIKELLLDLRDNPGGILSETITAIECLMPTGLKILGTNFNQYLQHENEEYFTSQDSQIPQIAKIVILVNENSASASEILAAAFQDNAEVLQEQGVCVAVLGETTYGKGSVQELVFFQNGTGLKLTIADWLTPAGNRIQDQGVEPDSAAIDDLDTENVDEGLQEALQLFRSSNFCSLH